MERFSRKYKTILIALAALFAVLFIAVLALTRNIGGHQGAAGEHPLRISELMSNNKTVPNADGVLCDWLELENTADSPFDLAGYKLSDQLTGAKYSFPVGTVVPAHGYLVVSCTADYTGGLYAPFSLSRDGGETVVLMNAANVILDRVETLPARKNTVMVRAADGSLTLSAAPTPGYPNTEEGHRQYLASLGERSDGVRLSELVSGNSFYPNDDGVCCDWVELVNTGSDPVDIGGYRLSDKPGESRYAFPAGTVLGPGEYLTVSCAVAYTGRGYAPFNLSQSGETVVLSDAGGAVLEQVELPALAENHAWALVDGVWTDVERASPGFPNTEDGYLAFCARRGYGDVNVIVSEAAASNPALLADADGDFPDWLELENLGGSPVDLSGWYLTDDGADPAKWRLPAGTTLPAGGYLLVFASGKDKSDGQLHSSFSLSAGETVSLVTPVGQICSALSLAGLERGESAVAGDGGAQSSAWPTPGFPNTDAGWAQFQESQSRTSPLLIYTVAPSNASRYEQFGVGYSDYVILKNVSDGPLELSDYCLSNDCDDPALWRLPAGTLEPGDTVVYLCSGDESNSAQGYVHTNFTLGAAGETLLLYRADGALCDYVWLHHVPADGSCGREEGQNGFFIYAAGRTRVGRSVSPMPRALTDDGVFDGVDGVTVTLEGPAAIYYTTDGSLPTAASQPYTGPVTVHETCVLRACCAAEGQLESPALTLSYIINEGHALPVVSLAAEPSDLFGNGIYDTYLMPGEAPASAALYEDGKRFVIDCGLEMHGHKGLILEKRSFKLNFRPRYGAEYLRCDLFDNGVDVYSSVLLRAGQDYLFANLRDELVTSLCADFTDSVLTQAYKTCVLYINGEYWGVYRLKEAFSEEYYAAHRDVSPGSVTVAQAPVDSASPFREALDLALNSDMSLDENYQAFCALVDMDSLIDWCVFEGYSANGDVQQNLRYFRSTENGDRWEFALYDLDWAFYYEDNDLSKVFAAYDENGYIMQHSAYLSALLKNADFRDRFCTRLAEALAGPLSTENVLARIDQLAAEQASEAARDRARWRCSPNWDNYLEQLRAFIRNGWTQQVIDGAVRYCQLSASQRQHYFGGLGT